MEISEQEIWNSGYSDNRELIMISERKDRSPETEVRRQRN